MQYIRGGQWLLAPRSSHIIVDISRILWLQATPPPSRISDLPVCARALSATSIHAAKACSCRLQQTASKGLPSRTNLFAALIIPENAKSIPCTAYGNSNPSNDGLGLFSNHSSAFFSITGPPGKGIPWFLANLSSIFPIPMSNVSPRTRYLPSNLAITCVFPPLTYSRIGSSQPHCSRPISMWATQWLTPIRGTSRWVEIALAAAAPVLRHAPIPGPCE